MRVVSSVWLKHDLGNMLDALQRMAPRDDHNGYYVQALDAMRTMLDIAPSQDRHGRTLWTVSQRVGELEAGR